MNTIEYSCGCKYPTAGSSAFHDRHCASCHIALWSSKSKPKHPLEFAFTSETFNLDAKKERISAVAAALQGQAEGEVGRLRSLGWTQADFARALKELLEARAAD